MIAIIIVAAYININYRYYTSDVFELEEVAKNCVSQIKNLNVTDGDSILVVESKSGKLYTYSEGVVRRATAHGAAFKVFLENNVNIFFSYDECPELEFKYILYYDREKLSCEIKDSYDNRS
jgi:hypothetical protein